MPTSRPDSNATGQVADALVPPTHFRYTVIRGDAEPRVCHRTLVDGACSPRPPPDSRGLSASLEQRVPQREVEPDGDDDGHEREVRDEQQRLGGVEEPRATDAAGRAEARREAAAEVRDDRQPERAAERRRERLGVRRGRTRQPAVEDAQHDAGEAVEGLRPEDGGDDHHGPAADQRGQGALRPGREVVGADERVHHAEVAVSALRDRRPERERERGQGRDDEQRHERGDEAEV